MKGAEKEKPVGQGTVTGAQGKNMVTLGSEIKEVGDVRKRLGADISCCHIASGDGYGEELKLGDQMVGPSTEMGNTEEAQARKSEMRAR